MALEVQINGNASGLQNAISQSTAGLNKFSRDGQRSIQSLQIQLQSYQRIAANATDPNVLSEYNKRIQQTQGEITRLGNVGKTGFDTMGNAIQKSTNLLGGAYGALKVVANILPGLGIAGLIGFAAQPLIEYISKLEIIRGTARQIAQEAAFDSEPYKKAVSDVTRLGTSLNEFHSGLVTGKSVVSQYNDGIGKTAGKLTTVQEIEDFYNSKSANYVKAVMLRAQAQSALQTAVDARIKAEKRASTNSFGDYLGASGSVLTGILTGRYIGDKTISGDFRDALNVFKKKDVDELRKDADDATKIFAQLQKEADKFNKSNGINLNGDGDTGGKTVKLTDILKELNQALERTQVQLGSTFDSRNVAQISAYQSAIDKATDAFGRQSEAVRNLREEQARLLQLGVNTPISSVNDSLPAQRNSLGQVGLDGIKVQDATLAAFKAGLKPAPKQVGDQLQRELSRSVARFGQEFYQTLTTLNAETDQTFTGIFSKLTKGLTSAMDNIFLNVFQKKLTSAFESSTATLGKGLTNALSGAGLLGGAISGITKPTSTIGQGAGGALSGAATGAVLGSALPGLGTLAGGIIGGAIGAIGGIFGSSKAKKQEELQKKQLAEAEKQTKLQERQNALAYTASIIGRGTSSGIVTGIEANERGELVAKFSGQDMLVTLDKARAARERGA